MKQLASEVPKHYFYLLHILLQKHFRILLKHHQFFLQLPMAVLSPGRAPVTRYERETMLETANEVFLYQEDITSIDKQSIPIVLG